MADVPHSTRTDSRARTSRRDTEILRERMEAAVERLLAALDALDAPTEDMEDDDPGGGDVVDEPHDEDSDAEPWLGSPNWVPQTMWGAGTDDDREDDGDDREEDDNGVADADALAQLGFHAPGWIVCE